MLLYSAPKIIEMMILDKYVYMKTITMEACREKHT